MNKLELKHVAAMYQLVRDCIGYEAAVSDPNRPQGIAALFSRRPRDPFPEGTSRAKELFSYAVDGAFPYLNERAAGPAGPLDYRSSFEASFNGNEPTALWHTSSESMNLFHDERYEFRKGYGFSHSYQHDKDLEKDARNRAYAYGRAMENRFKEEPFFRDKARQVDDMRSRMRLIEGMTFERAELRSLIADVQEYRAEREARSAAYTAIVEDSVIPVTAFEDYVRVRTEMAVLSGRAGSEMDANIRELQEEKTMELQARYDGLRRSVDSLGTTRLCDIINNAVVPEMKESEILDWARARFSLVYGKDPDDSANIRSVLVVYSDIARRDGVSRNTILQTVDDTLQRAGYSETDIQLFDRRNVEPVIDNVDYTRKKSVEAAIDRDVRDGKSGDFADSSYSASFENYAASLAAGLNDSVRADISRMDELSKAKVFLDYELEGERSPRVIAETLFEKLDPKGLTLSGLADALSVENRDGLKEFSVDARRSELESAMNGVYADRMLEGSPDLDDVLAGIKASSSGPKTMLAYDMAWAAFAYGSEGDRQKLGAFLREVGIKPEPDIPLSWSILRAAGRMYGSGEAQDIGRVRAFRERHGDVVTALKKTRVESGKRISLKKLRSGPSL